LRSARSRYSPSVREFAAQTEMRLISFLLERTGSACFGPSIAVRVGSRSTTGCLLAMRRVWRRIHVTYSSELILSAPPAASSAQPISGTAGLILTTGLFRRMFEHWRLIQSVVTFLQGHILAVESSDRQTMETVGPL